MKSKFIAVALVSGLMASLGAYAEPIVSGAAIDNGDCVLLGETVTLNLSNNVSGAYNCVEATSTITLGACHASGSRNPTTVNCVNSAAPGDAPVWNDTSCQDAGDTFEITDFRGFRASSQGGRVGVVALGGTCSDQSIDAVVTN